MNEIEQAKFDGFCETLERLWDRCPSREQIEATAWSTLRWRTAEVVQAAVGQHRREDYDLVKPSLKRIVALVVGDESQQTNHFQALLNNVRRHLEERGVKGCREWNNAEVYQNYVDANTYPITHHTIGPKRGLPQDDPDGRRARLAADWRKREGQRWRRYLVNHEFEVPAFLEE